MKVCTLIGSLITHMAAVNYDAHHRVPLINIYVLFVLYFQILHSNNQQNLEWEKKQRSFLPLDVFEVSRTVIV